jgi:hypothetical protein
MKRKQPSGPLILTHALQSLAVAITIVFLGHFLIWLVAQGVMIAGRARHTPAYFGDRTGTP